MTNVNYKHELQDFLNRVGCKSDEVVDYKRLGLKSTTTLKPYQEKALKEDLYKEITGQLSITGRLLNADMGLGKTLMSICFMIEWMKEHHVDLHSKHVLILLPKTLARQWQVEFFKHTNIPPSIIKLYVEKCVDFPELDAHGTNIVISTYSLILHSYRHKVEDFFQMNQFGLMIFDEGQTYKEPKRLTYKVVANLVSLNQHAYKLPLSGTFFVNRWQDYETQAMVIGKTPYNSHSWWKTNHTVVPEVKNWRADSMISIRRKDISQSLGLPIFIKNPDKELELDSDLVDFYATLGESVKNLMKKSKKTKEEGEQIGARICYLRQICCHPILIGDKKLLAHMSSIGLVPHKYEQHTPKTKWLTETVKKDLSESPRQKVFIFSSFVGFIHMIENFLKLEVPLAKIGIIKGKQTYNERQKIIDGWQTQDPDDEDFINVVIIQTKTGGTGFDMPCGDCPVNIYFADLPWNPSSLIQAEARVFRLGQRAKVTTTRAYYKDSIEEWMLKIIKAKEQEEELLDAGKIPKRGTKITKEALRAYFQQMVMKIVHEYFQKQIDELSAVQVGEFEDEDEPEEEEEQDEDEEDEVRFESVSAAPLVSKNLDDVLKEMDEYRENLEYKRTSKDQESDEPEEEEEQVESDFRDEVTVEPKQNKKSTDRRKPNESRKRKKTQDQYEKLTEVFLDEILEWKHKWSL